MLKTRWDEKPDQDDVLFINTHYLLAFIKSDEFDLFDLPVSIRFLHLLDYCQVMILCCRPMQTFLLMSY